ncbi:unnamed protein product [Prunus armeniaca]
MRQINLGPGLGQATVKVARDQKGAPDLPQVVLRLAIRNYGEVVRQVQGIRSSEGHPELRLGPLGQLIEKLVAEGRGIVLLGGPGECIGQQLGLGDAYRTPQLLEVCLQLELEGPQWTTVLRLHPIDNQIVKRAVDVTEEE